MDTKKTTSEIEVAIAKHFDIRKNIIVFGVTEISGLVQHECDVLIMARNGYLTEVEIKRSYTDFLNEFKKSHNHLDDTVQKIHKFYYCVPKSIVEKVIAKLIEMEWQCDGVYSYNEDEDIRLSWHKVELPYKARLARKLFIEEQLQLARLGAMRVVALKEKLNQ